MREGAGGQLQVVTAAWVLAPIEKLAGLPSAVQAIVPCGHVCARVREGSVNVSSEDSRAGGLGWVSCGSGAAIFWGLSKTPEAGALDRSLLPGYGRSEEIPRLPPGAMLAFHWPTLVSVPLRTVPASTLCAH